MRVRELACFGVDIPTKDDSYVMSHGRVLHSFPSTVVRVTADDGTTGYGEACTLGGSYLDGFPASAQATIRTLAPSVLGCDPFAAGVLVDEMDAHVIGHLPGKAAIDIAMWDLRGRLLGRPVSSLLGGAAQQRLGAFQAISLDAPQRMADEVRRMADLGFRRWQLKLGDDPVADAARVHAAVAAQPADSAFMTSDANGGWSVAESLRFLTAIDGADTYVEQPCRTIPELARVRAGSRHPLMIDESARTAADVLDAIGRGCMDAINLKPVRVGGLTKAARIRDLALAAGIMVLVDEPQGADLATASMAHLAATVPPDRYLGVSYFMGSHMKLSYQSPGADTGPMLRDGLVSLDDAPGLGLSIDEATLGEPLFVCASGDL